MRFLQDNRPIQVRQAAPQVHPLHGSSAAAISSPVQELLMQLLVQQPYQLRAASTAVHQPTMLQAVKIGPEQLAI